MHLSSCVTQTILIPTPHPLFTWMVKTMPTKPAVRRATPKELGPTIFSWSAVFFQCILPAPKTDLFRQGSTRQPAGKQPSKTAISQAKPGGGEAKCQVACRTCTLKYAHHNLAAQHDARHRTEQPLWWLELVHPAQDSCRAVHGQRLVSRTCTTHPAPGLQAVL